MIARDLLGAGKVAEMALFQSRAPRGIDFAGGECFELVAEAGYIGLCEHRRGDHAIEQSQRIVDDEKRRADAARCVGARTLGLLVDGDRDPT